MNNVGSKVKRGLFEMSERQGDKLLKLLSVTGSGVWFDPICGEGNMLHQLSQPFQTGDCKITTYGVEMETESIKGPGVPTALY